MVYVFDEFELDLDAFELRKSGVVQHLEPQVFDVLACLIQNCERLVTKEELMDRVWGDRFISEAALNSRLMAARRVLGDNGKEQRFIRTQRGRGFRFVGDVRAVDANALAESTTPPPPQGEGAKSGPENSRRTSEQEVRFLQSLDGTTIAYAVSGKGKPLVKAANWLSHLEYDHQSIVWRHWWRDLPARYTLIRYDERGCGLSDWDVEFSFNAWVEDLEAVVDKTGVNRFALLGISQGTAVAITYAVRHPERISHLVLYGGFAQGRLQRDVPEAKKDEARLLENLVKVGWGRDAPIFRRVFASLFLPEGTPEQFESFDALQRASTSPENAARFVRIFNEIDVTDLAGQVRTPRFVVHAKDEAELPLEQARLLASKIPDARLVLLDSRSHILGESEAGWARFLEEVDAFLAT